MIELRLPDGSAPPFGATVKNENQQNTGIVNDGGSVYLSGIQPGETMTVSWGGRERCTLVMPETLPVDGLVTTLSLVCHVPASEKTLSAPTSLTDKRIETEKKTS